MLRWVAVSPDGKRVAYQALGYVYVKDLPDGAPHRLTKPDRPLRVLPVLVARLEVARLHDLERRHARVDPRRRVASGGASRVVTDKPGHYFEPVFSPDGSKIVYRKDDGRLSRRDAWSADPGLYWVSAAGRRQVHPDHRGRRRAALRQGERPRLLRQDRGRRGPDRAGEAHPRLDQARRLRAARVLPLRPRHRVRDLARRQVARVPRGLQRVRDAVRRDRPPRRHRPEEQGRAGDARLEGRGREPPLLRRLVAPLLGVRPAALPARPQGGVRVPARRAGEAAGAAGEGPGRSASRSRSTCRDRRVSRSPAAAS